MMTTPVDDNPFYGLAEEAIAILHELLATEGLTDEAPNVLPPFERAVRAAVTAVEAEMPADLPLDFALAYLTGRIAKEQVIALQNARNLANAARTRAEHHWKAAIEAERHRLALESSMIEPKQVESV